MACYKRLKPTGIDVSKVFIHVFVANILLTMIDDLAYTMLQKLILRCSTLAALHDNNYGNSVDKDPLIQKLTHILEPEDAKSQLLNPIALDSTEMASIQAKSPPVQTHEYAALQDYLLFTGCAYRTYTDIPHPEFALVLPPIADRPREINVNDHTYSCYSSHIGNSAIQFCDPKTQRMETGSIHLILQMPLQGFMRTFLFVYGHAALTPAEEQLTPYPTHPRFMTKVVDAIFSDTVFIIEPQHIITHLTTFKRPAGTFGISREILLVCWALNRGRK